MYLIGYLRTFNDPDEKGLHFVLADPSAGREGNEFSRYDDALAMIRNLGVDAEAWPVHLIDEAGIRVDEGPAGDPLEGSSRSRRAAFWSIWRLRLRRLLKIRASGTHTAAI